MALGNLWHMLLATAMAPGAPMVIMAGVRTKAPPEPIKPLRRPPISPMISRAMILETFMSMNMMSMLLMTFSPACLSRLTITFLSILTSSGTSACPRTRCIVSSLPAFLKVVMRVVSSTLRKTPFMTSFGGGPPAKADETMGRMRNTPKMINNNFFILYRS